MFHGQLVGRLAEFGERGLALRFACLERQQFRNLDAMVRADLARGQIDKLDPSDHHRPRHSQQVGRLFRRLDRTRPRAGSFMAVSMQLQHVGRNIGGGLRLRIQSARRANLPYRLPSCWEIRIEIALIGQCLR